MSEELAVQARWLVDTIVRRLRKRTGPGIGEVLEKLGQQDLMKPQDFRAQSLPACRYLAETVAATMIVDPSLAAAAASCVDDLNWRQTPGYSDEALGQGFMDDYCHCELIGSHGVFPGDDYRLGLLILGPHRHYRDHFHPAPELYWPLTGPSQWKRGHGGFETREAGETIWHDANIVHATKTDDTPLLAVWIWTRDTATSARLL